jgi:hypothetical protein
MNKLTIITLLFLTSCITYSPQVQTAQDIATAVQKEWWKNNDVKCIEYSNEIQRRCREQGVLCLQATFATNLHRALIVEGMVIDSTGAMSYVPIKLSELEKKTGFKLHKVRLKGK